MSEFFTELYNFITSGIFGVFTDFGNYIVDLLTIAYYELGAIGINVTSDLVHGFTNDINAASQVVTFWNNIPIDIRAVLTAARIPEVMAIMGSAYAVRFAMMILGF